MSRFERDLRESLRRRQPPAGFAEQVIARARARERRSMLTLRRWVAIAAVLLLMAGGIALVREQRRQAQAAHNKQQLIVALQIASSKLNRVQGRLSAIQQRIDQLHLEQQQ
jgi:hypothetical protein